MGKQPVVSINSDIQHIVNKSKNNDSVLKQYEQDSKDIQQICQPFFDKTGITSFFYLRIFANGSRIFLSNNFTWLNHYVKAGYFKHHAHTLNYLTNKTRAFALWDGFHYDEIYQTAYEYHVCHGFTIYEHSQHADETYLFSTHQDNRQLTNFYLNNLDLLYAFIADFKVKAKAMISPQSNNTLVIAENLHNNDYIKNLMTNHDLSHYQQMQSLASFRPPHMSPLSPRETECLTWAARGKTSQETAMILGLSHYTINEHLATAIKKLNTCNKAMAIAKAVLNNFINVDEFRLGN